MVSLLRAKAPGCAGTLTRQILRSRAFQTSLPLRAVSETVEGANDGKKGKGASKSKKKLSELPRAHILPDGTPAVPLKMWYGGLGKSATSSPTSIDVSRPADAGSAEAVESDIDPKVSPVPENDGTDVSSEAPKTPRKRRKKAVPEEEVAESNIHAVEEPKKTRKRRSTKKQDETEEAVLEEPAKPRKPRSTKKKDESEETILVETKKPRKRRSVKALAETSDLRAEGEGLRMVTTTTLPALIQANLQKYPHCILLTRVGQFYESYFDQAIEVARLLNIKLTKRTFGGIRTPMCGFPLTHLDRHMKALVQHNKKFVALCEEFPVTRYGSTIFERRVVRIVTPGTLIDESFLNPYENNYLLSISSGQSSAVIPVEPSNSDAVGLAWIDVSTGEFFTKNTTCEGLHDEVVRINPREVVLESTLLQTPSHPIRLAVAEEGYFVSYSSAAADGSSDNVIPKAGVVPSMDDVTSHTDAMPLTEGSALSDTEAEAVSLLTTYLRDHLLEHMPQLSSPTKESVSGRMQIDAHTLKALEIREGFRDGGAVGSLLSVIKRTVTTSGTRLLARWLCSPSTSSREINARQSLVAFFHARAFLRDDIVQYLKQAEDATRIVQKFLVGRGCANDLAAICNTVDVWSAVSKRIELEKNMELKERGEIQAEEWASLDALMVRIGDLRDLADRIRKAVVNQGTPLQNVEAVEEELQSTENEISPFAYTRDPRYNFGTDTQWTIRSQFSEELTQLHDLLKDLHEERESLQSRLALEYDTPSLTLRSSPNLGMHVHVGRGKRGRARLDESDLFILLSESQSTTTYFNQEWAQLGKQIVDTVTEILVREREAFELLRNEVNSRAVHLRRNARILDELDVTIAFANLAQEMSFARPTIRDDTSYSVTNGRHPTVELGLLTNGRAFIPNTVSFSPSSQFHIITGPNMAGKSTLLRQTALIAILAQTGSYVPADSAEIGIVDRVFSRVGARDDLFHDRSTFMVEMLETSDIMRRATPNSLVIMDEVGRGTTVEDGLAIAFAVVHHLQTVNGCRALFATHFHELADMLGITEDSKGTGAFQNVSFFCTDVDETEDGYFAYSHRLRPGINRNSHGLKVAQLAGMPEPAVEVARTALTWLKQRRATQHNDRSDLHAIGQSLTTP